MKVTLADDNVRARIHLGLLRLYGAITAVASYRGSQTLSWKLGRLFPEDDAVIVEIFEDKKICVHLNDGYWTKLLFDNFIYEPEVEFVLNSVLGHGSFFLDCGSNIGYWSIFASKYIDLPEQIVAVEPSHRTFARLERNRVLNGGSFTCVRAAVFSSPDIELELTTHIDRHAGDSVTDTRGIGKQDLGYSRERVRSETIDRIAHGATNKEAVVIKLDVEGAEIEALKGASRTIKNGALLIYEDHRRDPACRVTEFIIESLGCDVYQTYDNKFMPVPDVDYLRRLKRERPQINNLVALKKDSPLADLFRRA